MDGNKPRIPRTLVDAPAVVLDLQSNRSMGARSRDLSIAGCYLEMPDPPPVRSAISLTLTYGESDLTLLCDVVRSEPGKGMGVIFKRVEPAQSMILKGWLFAANRQGW